MDFGRLLGPHLVPFERHFEDLGHQTDSTGQRVEFLVVLVAFRSGRSEEKHGIYCAGHTLPSLVKSHVLYPFWTHFGAHLGALGHILELQGGTGNKLEF